MVTNSTVEEKVKRESKRKNFLRKRGFLNSLKTRGTGIIFSDVTAEKEIIFKDKEPEKQHGWITSYLDISDCNRKISLDFGFNLSSDSKKRESYNNAIGKIKVIKDYIARLEEALMNAKNWIENE